MSTTGYPEADRKHTTPYLLPNALPADEAAEDHASRLIGGLCALADALSEWEDSPQRLHRAKMLAAQSAALVNFLEAFG